MPDASNPYRSKHQRAGIYPALRVILYRVLAALFTLFLLSLLCFALLERMPGDPVIQLSGLDAEAGQHFDARYLEGRKRLKLDLPAFYLDIRPRCMPDSLYRLWPQNRQERARELAWDLRNSPVLSAYLDAESILLRSLQSQPDPACQASALALLQSDSQAAISKLALERQIPAEQQDSTFADWLAARRSLAESAPQPAWWLPELDWWGTDNRYHRWLSALLGGDAGISLVDGRPVREKIGRAFTVSLQFGLLGLVMSFVLAIPLALQLALHRHRWRSRFALLLLDILYALPVFWVGSLALVFITGPAYLDAGEYFPAYSELDWAGFVLPWLCLLPGQIAYLAQFLYRQLVAQLREPYGQTALSRGMSELRRVGVHALRPAIIPYIFSFAMALPAIFAGSLVLEVLFSIPGMGRLTYIAITGRDWPLLYALILLSGVLTLGGYALSFILVRLADPRLRSGISESSNKAMP